MLPVRHIYARMISSTGIAPAVLELEPLSIHRASYGKASEEPCKGFSGTYFFFYQDIGMNQSDCKINAYHPQP